MGPEVSKNVLKNFLIVLILFFAYNYIQSSLTLMNPDSTFAQTFLLAISFILLCAMFGCFTFKYDDASKKTMLLGHFITGLFMLVTGLIFEAIIILMAMPIITILTVLTYVALVMYDFWDLLKVKGV